MFSNSFAIVGTLFFFVLRSKWFDCGRSAFVAKMLILTHFLKLFGIACFLLMNCLCFRMCLPMLLHFNFPVEFKIALFWLPGRFLMFCRFYNNVKNVLESHVFAIDLLMFSQESIQTMTMQH